jgi:hypothetical protein
MLFHDVPASCSCRGRDARSLHAKATGARFMDAPTGATGTGVPTVRTDSGGGLGGAPHRHDYC